MTRRITIFVALYGCVVGFMPAHAPAQVIEPMPPPAPGQPLVLGKTVTDRAREGLDPSGIWAGDFTFFPRAEIDGSYNDNIFARQNSRIDSWLTTLMPSFDLQSNFARNAIDASAGAAIGRFSGHSSEDFDDGYGTLGGRIDIDALHRILAGVRFDRLHELRTSPVSPANAAEPVRYTTYAGNVGVAGVGTPLAYQVDGIATRTEYEASRATGGGFVFQDDRNVTGFEGALRLGYEFQSGYQAYIRGSGNTQQFDHAAGNGIPTRDSNGYRLDLGIRIDLPSEMYADFYGGYLQQDFSANQFGSLQGIDYGARVVWNFTAIDTLKLGLTRTANNANAEVAGIATSPGYLAAIESLSLDHEVVRDVLLNFNLGYEVDAWRGIGRTDRVLGVGVGGKYLLNPYLYLGAGYNYQQRNSSGGQPGTPYGQNVVTVRLSTQL